MPRKEIVHSIGTVESEVGISRDVLRKWEARYDFPSPGRNKRGERIYNLDQVSRLRLIKRLIDTGIRPSMVVPESAGDLIALAKQIQVRIDGGEESKVATVLLRCLRDHDLVGLRRQLQHLLLKQGLYKFILDTVAPLTYFVGEAWSQNELEVYEEHIFSEVLQDVLRNAMDTLTNGNKEGGPRILLTTPPDEAHMLGILMASNLFALEGAYCIFLGAQTPLKNIASAALSQRIDIVALSFSLSYPQHRIAPILSKLRALLPEEVAIWAGGDGVSHISKKPAGLTVIPTLEGIREAFLKWGKTRTV